MTDLTRLRELAQKATPGRWSTINGLQKMIPVQPSTILALLDENDRLREALRTLCDAVQTNGLRGKRDVVEPAAHAVIAARAALESSEPTNRVLTDDGLVAGESSGGTGDG